MIVNHSMSQEQSIPDSKRPRYEDAEECSQSESEDKEQQVATDLPHKEFAPPEYCFKGVNYTFLDRATNVLEELKCPICLELVSDPVQTSCGHLFCGKCINGAPTCPVDRKRFTKTTDHFNKRRLGNFRVLCPNSEKGCEWEGELRASEEHTATTCEYQAVKCVKGCAGEVERRHLALHWQESCGGRQYACPHCTHSGTYDFITRCHVPTCGSFPLPCPAGCNEQLTRGSIAGHLSSTCPGEWVECAHKMVGCTSIVKRKDLEEHTSDKDHHFAVLMKSQASVLCCLSASFQNKGDPPQLSLLPLPCRPWLQNTPTSYPRPPWVVTMEGYQEKKEEGCRWFSDPVYSHFGGYKVCLSVYPNGISTGEGTFMSLFVHLMRGDNDNNLKWPFKGTIKVSLLNQLEDGQHRSRMPWMPDKEVPGTSTDRVTNGERAIGWGHAQFVPHKDLGYHRDKNCQYLKDDTVFIRVDSFAPELD